MEVLIAILGGSALGALINKVGDYFINRMKHKYKQEDFEDQRIKALIDGVRYLLLTAIKESGLQHLQEESISFEDRRLLHKMHKVYHDGLNGNGDLDELMRDIDNMPLK